MDKIRVRIVEDNKGELETYKMNIEDFNSNGELPFESEIARTLDEALKMADSSFDVALVDIRLGKDTDGGNTVIEQIIDTFRMPVVVVTGTSGRVDSQLECVKISSRIDPFMQVLAEIVTIYKTGITKILGGRGEIERAMDKVYRQNIVLRLDSWKSYVEEGKDTERALLRLTINHLLELLQNDTSTCFPEEMYIYPPMSNEIKTGNIVREKEGDRIFIVLSPACDLVVRPSGQRNTDRILLCRILDSIPNIDKILGGNENEDNKITRISRQLSKNEKANYHWLPNTGDFEGGFINFRRITTLSIDEYNRDFNDPVVKVSSFFIRDIIARFSSYYARQGQPDFDSGSVRSIAGTIVQRSNDPD